MKKNLKEGVAKEMPRLMSSSAPPPHTQHAMLACTPASLRLYGAELHLPNHVAHVSESEGLCCCVLWWRSRKVKMEVDMRSGKG